MGNLIVEIRRSYDRLISTMGFPILVRRHLYIESGPCCSWVLSMENSRTYYGMLFFIEISWWTTVQPLLPRVWLHTSWGSSDTLMVIPYTKSVTSDDQDNYKPGNFINWQPSIASPVDLQDLSLTIFVSADVLVPNTTTQTANIISTVKMDMFSSKFL